MSTLRKKNFGPLRWFDFTFVGRPTNTHSAVPGVSNDPNGSKKF